MFDEENSKFSGDIYYVILLSDHNLSCHETNRCLTSTQTICGDASIGWPSIVYLDWEFLLPEGFLLGAPSESSDISVSSSAMTQWSTIPSLKS